MWIFALAVVLVVGLWLYMMIKAFKAWGKFGNDMATMINVKKKH